MSLEVDARVRPAVLGDAESIWTIRNQPQTRANSFSEETIELKDHVAWFSKKYFAEADNHCFVLVQGSKVIGYTRFDKKDENIYEVSIAIDAAEHGRGRGSFLLKESVQSFFSAGSRKIIAKIKRTNIASLKLFEKCGFKINRESEAMFEMDFSPYLN